MKYLLPLGILMMVSLVNASQSCCSDWTACDNGVTTRECDCPGSTVEYCSPFTIGSLDSFNSNFEDLSLSQDDSSITIFERGFPILEYFDVIDFTSSSLITDGSMIQTNNLLAEKKIWLDQEYNFICATFDETTPSLDCSNGYLISCPGEDTGAICSFEDSQTLVHGIFSSVRGINKPSLPIGQATEYSNSSGGSLIVGISALLLLGVGAGAIIYRRSSKQNAHELLPITLPLENIPLSTSKSDISMMTYVHDMAAWGKTKPEIQSSLLEAGYTPLQIHTIFEQNKW